MGIDLYRRKDNNSNTNGYHSVLFLQEFTSVMKSFGIDAASPSTFESKCDELSGSNARKLAVALARMVVNVTEVSASPSESSSQQSSQRSQQSQNSQHSHQNSPQSTPPLPQVASFTAREPALVTQDDRSPSLRVPGRSPPYVSFNFRKVVRKDSCESMVSTKSALHQLHTVHHTASCERTSRRRGFK